MVVPIFFDAKINTEQSRPLRCCFFPNLSLVSFKNTKLKWRAVANATSASQFSSEPFHDRKPSLVRFLSL